MIAQWCSKRKDYWGTIVKLGRRGKEWTSSQSAAPVPKGHADMPFHTNRNHRDPRHRGRGCSEALRASSAES
eukprot:1161486-Pelagomonas_calceolata.AAC.14